MIRPNTLKRNRNVTGFGLVTWISVPVGFSLRAGIGLEVVPTLTKNVSSEAPACIRGV
jgi:hypothetical protein